MVPIPAVSFLPLFVQAGHNFWIAIAIIIAGVTLGDGIGYLVGAAGHGLISEGSRNRAAHLEKWADKYKHAPLIALLLFAALVPLPNEIIIIPLALIGYTWKKLLPWLLVGNSIFNTTAAFGVVNLFKAIL